MWEESLQCLSLLVRLCGGAAEDFILTRSCLQSFLHVLRTHLQDETARSTLEIIHCSVNTHIMMGVGREAAIYQSSLYTTSPQSTGCVIFTATWWPFSSPVNAADLHNQRFRNVGLCYFSLYLYIQETNTMHRRVTVI